MKKMSVLEVLSKLSTNQELQGVRVSSNGQKTYIRWVNHAFDASYTCKQLAFINIYNEVDFDILTEPFLQHNSSERWTIEAYEEKGEEMNGI